MNFDRLDVAQARDIALRAAAILANDPRVQLVFLFGSTAARTRPTVGDVDLAVLANPAISTEDFLRLRADIVDAVDADVDLVSLNDSSIVLAHEVADDGECLFSRSNDAEVAFITRARAEYWDFKPFLDEQWRLAGERLEERRNDLKA